MTGKKLYDFPSKQKARNYGFPGISKALNGSQLHCGGYIWRHATPDNACRIEVPEYTPPLNPATEHAFDSADAKRRELARMTKVIRETDDEDYEVMFKDRTVVLPKRAGCVALWYGTPEEERLP